MVCLAEAAASWFLPSGVMGVAVHLHMGCCATVWRPWLRLWLCHPGWWLVLLFLLESVWPEVSMRAAYCSSVVSSVCEVKSSGCGAVGCLCIEVAVQINNCWQHGSFATHQKVVMNWLCNVFDDERYYLCSTLLRVERLWKCTLTLARLPELPIHELPSLWVPLEGGG